MFKNKGPSRVDIARALCDLPVFDGTPTNFERQCLLYAHRFLAERPPNIAGARAELAEGVAHAFREFREERPEAWIVAACAELLKE